MKFKKFLTLLLIPFALCSCDETSGADNTDYLRGEKAILEFKYPYQLEDYSWEYEYIQMAAVYAKKFKDDKELLTYMFPFLDANQFSRFYYSYRTKVFNGEKFVTTSYSKAFRCNKQEDYDELFNHKNYRGIEKEFYRADDYGRTIYTINVSMKN